MTYQDLISAFGNGTKAAESLGYSKQTISNWKKAGIPEDKQIDIHRKMKGQLKADASILAKYREILRPA